MLSFAPTWMPGLVQVFPLVLALTLLLARRLRAHPGTFYALVGGVVAIASWANVAMAVMGDDAHAIVVAFDAAVEQAGQSNPVASLVLALCTSSYAGVSIYLIVMFVGALPRTPAVRRLLSVRSELSILGGIIIAGHVLRVFDFPSNFSDPMFSLVWGDAACAWVFVATAVIGPALTVAFVVPWVLSFPAVRRRMNPHTWKRVQRAFCYPFMALMLAQGFCLAVGHALIAYPWDGVMAQRMLSVPQEFLGTFAQQVATAWIYALLAVAYAALRIGKALSDRRARAAREVARASRRQARDASPQAPAGGAQGVARPSGDAPYASPSALEDAAEPAAEDAAGLAAEDALA
ncbi:MAG: hypothetical protein SOI26_03135 [Coriobacteriales bacterium]